ncbi:type I restriction enzyme HsdR N-terminal domain-containing protein [Flavobacterium sp. F-380]|uniref:Type I restriction enzyme HsdR N-terminal domain-containing protein n=1 Tax=Flavobacterium kayseriense TaxID=2764714 RepID=A0ABR7JAT0_9FLAO|nr:type I restriction enzyme HsdR N-terminal domain-containing protein [Flavobacterium kayseriense]MBC5842638.1 type I restriction enzyme HsdR N-terminal domain-containing protein [Flavobacterium kayseriense]MBC5849168.1 type I restriction enzyme HsdR N-terminal domain-containing protein [Flavobacterium kayseriense]
MNNEKWAEICYLLSESVQPDISENAFEKNIIQALRVLNWKQFLNDFDIRPSFQVGASNRITPDFVMKSAEQNKLFVIEIKQPNIPLNSNFQQQLFSYMRYLKLEYGILIGQSIQIFYDGDLVKQEDPVLLETIKFEHSNERGLTFVELFDKENYSKDALKDFTLNSLKKINLKQDFKELTNKIISGDFIARLNELVKQDFISEYDGELIDSVLKELKFEITEKFNPVRAVETPRRQFAQPKDSNYSSTILPIELNPPGEYEFKRKLLAAKKAYITTFYANGTNDRKLWNANSFKESSLVLGNIRSRPQFRNGNWQELGIIKVFVSIDS